MTESCSPAYIILQGLARSWSRCGGAIDVQDLEGLPLLRHPPDGFHILYQNYLDLSVPSREVQRH